MLFRTLLIGVSLWLLVITPPMFAQTDSTETYLDFIKAHIQAPINLRSDFMYTTYENTTDRFQEDMRFQFTDFIMELQGLLHPQIGYNFRYVFYSNTIGTNGISDNVQYANLTFTTKNQTWLFIAGKTFLNVGTAEQSYDPNDVYVYSIIGNNIGVYKTGVVVQYQPSKAHVIGVQIANSGVDSLGNQSAFTYNAYWYGNLAHGSIKPFMSATMIPSTSHLANAYTVNIGVQWNIKKLRLDTDFSTAYNMPNLYNEMVYYSIPVRLQYQGEKWRPSIKYILNRVDTDTPISIPLPNNSSATISSLESHTFEGALQYYPLGPKNLRFHIAGVFTDDQNINFLVPQNGRNSISRNHIQSQYQIIAGIRVGFDVLHGWLDRE